MPERNVNMWDGKIPAVHHWTKSGQAGNSKVIWTERLGLDWNTMTFKRAGKKEYRPIAEA
ncbi:MAG: hypothetical protein JEZ02_07690 [Desulfatibacillum sp.]|nr:hypothetical protein [Desulfatibacillum sp.]